MNRKLFERIGNNDVQTAPQPQAYEHYPSMQQLYLQFTEQHQIAENVASINANVVQQAQALQGYVDTVEQRLNEATRKKRRIVTSRDIILDAQGTICLAEHYSDNSESKYSPLFVNAKGAWNVYRLKFEKIPERKEMFGIMFAETKHWIVGECGKVTESGLYADFIRAGIIFNTAIKIQHAKAALFQKFAPEINCCTNSWALPELAGMNNGKFLDATTVNFAARRDFPKFPILQKKFNYVKEAEKKSAPYFTAERNVKSWKARTLISVAPIVGLLSSIFADEGVETSSFLNFVMLDSSIKSKIVKMLQLFNRDKSEVVMAGMKDKDLREELQKVNDEVLLVNAEVKDSDKYYRRCKIHENVTKIITKICEKDNCFFGIHRNVNTALAVFSSGRILDKRAINVYVDKSFFADQEAVSIALNQEGFEAVMTLFVRYLEKNLDEIRGILQNLKKSVAYYDGFEWEMAWTVYQKFWKAYNIDFNSTLNLPRNINWRRLLNDMFDSEEIMDTFIHGVREHIADYPIVEKKYGCEIVDAVCVYDNEFFWIPPQFMQSILKGIGLMPYKLVILNDLRESGDLKTDSEGLSRRLKIGGKRVEMYQFRKAIFNVIGEPEITDLGGR